MKRLFFKYVCQNVLGMIGISFYILADTFFISKAVGTDGITALNMVLPVYSFIFAIGQMIGVGSAIRYSISRSRRDGEENNYFYNALIWGSLAGVIFMIAGIFAPDKIVSLLGGDEQIVSIGASYTRIFMGFAPCFIWNHIFNAFVRNDGAPAIAMAATLFSSLFNVVFDYVLMFKVGMGMDGAALATALSPVLGVIICCIHIFGRKSNIKIKAIMPSITKLINSCKLGIAAFVGEFSSGIIVILFNMLMLKYAGNTGVAAYGVVANTAMVAVSIFNGITNGVQPLISESYGKGDKKAIHQLVSLSIITGFFVAILLNVAIFFGNEFIVGIFNGENSRELKGYAEYGIKLYFIGYFFAGQNIIGSGLLSGMEAAKWASVVSVSRGFVVICLSAVFMSWIFGMTGVWLSFAVAEGITFVFLAAGLLRQKKEWN